MEIIDLYLFNSKKELIDIISDGSLIDNEQEQHLNGLITHTVSGVYTDSVEDADYFGLQDVDDNGVFWRYKIDTKNKREGKFTLDGTYELFDDLKGKKIITDLRPYNYTAVRALTALLSGTGWEVGNASTDKVGSSNWYYINTLSAFWDFLENWGVEFKPRMVFSQGKVIGRYIDIADKISDDYGKWYEYGSDLLTVEAETDLTNIATAYYGRGKGEEVSSAEDNASGQAGYGRKITFADIVWSTGNGNPVDKPLGQEFVVLPELTELYGFDDGTPRYDVVEFGDIEDKAELLQATYDYAIENARPKVQFKSTVNETDIAELGETVTIIRDDLNIRYKTRIFKIKRSFFNNKIKDFEFGDELIISQAKSAKQAQKATQKQIDEASTFWLVALREAITDSFWNEDGYNYDLRVDNEYGLPSGYYSFDRPIDQNPTKAIYMGAGKLLIANSKDPNGEWVWETALDGDGVMAEKIVGYNSEFVQSSWNAVNAFTQIDASGIKMLGSGTWRRTFLSPTGFRLFNGVDGSNKSGAIGYFKSSQDLEGLANPLNEDFMWQTQLRHAIGIGVNETHLLTLGYQLPGAENADGYNPALTIDPQKNGQVTISTDARFNSNLQVDGNLTLPGGDTFTAYNGLYLNTSYWTIQAKTGVRFFVGDQKKLHVGGNVELGTTLDMAGNVITGQSDYRLKKNIETLNTSDLDKLTGVRMVSYEWIDPERPEGTHIGFLAQELQEVYPEFITENTEGILSINNSGLAMAHIHATQELNAKVDEHISNVDTEIAKLKAQIASLQEELALLKGS